MLVLAQTAQRDVPGLPQGPKAMLGDPCAAGAYVHSAGQPQPAARPRRHGDVPLDEDQRSLQRRPIR